MKYTLDYKKYAELARRVAAEGSVLLRNEDEVLPLQKGQKVSIFGRTQFEHYKSGTGSGGMVNAPYVTNITDSLKEDGTVQVNEVLEAQYREWLKDHPFDIGEGWARKKCPSAKNWRDRRRNSRIWRLWFSAEPQEKTRIIVLRKAVIC
jgi:beta-glucosidase